MNDRKSKIIEILRKESRYVTASELAAELSVSAKTIYRDMQELLELASPQYKV
ncbi:HTH domain-containing protein [Metabacillus halosaccharovorans]|uniref:HTH domain-containing protein n=1 Tax=Metabacillus halosaccharovorans TaxID=930124 RepID=UPI0034CE12E1